jgi:hypothetical protein
MFAALAVTLSNSDFYRELAAHLVDRLGLMEMALLVENTSGITAIDARMVISIQDPNSLVLLKPKRELASFPSRESSVLIANVGSFLRDNGYSVQKVRDLWRAEYPVGKIQPRDHRLVQGLFVGSIDEVRTTVHVQLFADNLPAPHEQELELQIHCSTKEVCVADLKEFG